MTLVKICGIKDPENMTAAIEAGANFIGFVFYEPSPRYIEPDIAKTLSQQLPTGVKAVGLFVNPTDEYLEEITGFVPLDIIQLHGDESPQRVNAIREKFAMPVMKAIRVASAEDLSDLAEFEKAADWILFDAKSQSEYGGTGHAFDWGILKDMQLSKPWMLGGGLNAGNVKDALSILSPTAVDVSSGVEITRGQKDVRKIKDFIRAIKSSI